MLWWLFCSLVFATEFTVATLNIGHGRGSGKHQLLQSTAKVQSNIDKIADSMIPYELDVVALQESDTDAWWSGNQDQVHSLSQRLQMDYTLIGLHSQKSRLEYGTSLISEHAIHDAQSIRYRSSFPLPPKGFVIGRVRIDEQDVLVVSIHLDPRRVDVRIRQVDALHSVLKSLDDPVIVMGDFNVEWGPELEGYCVKLGLRPYEPTQPLVSFPKLHRRLDWILIGDELTFDDYWTESTTLSDHNLVVAKIGLSTSNQRASD